MIRAEMGDKRYWEKAVQNGWNAIHMVEEQLQKPSGVPTYRAEYVWGYAEDILMQTLTYYSRGDAVGALYNPFPKVLDAWELSNREAEKIRLEFGYASCRAWTFELSNLGFYNWCLWMVSLGLLFDVDDTQWARLEALVGGEGQDAVLDRLMAVRNPKRPLGHRVLHAKPYARLWKVLKSPQGEQAQAQALRVFVEHWYAELKRKGDKAIWWYDYGDPESNPLEKGCYFGRWCLEAVAVAKVFKIDDHLCLGHVHYPGDFLRPNGPSSHPNRFGFKAWLKKTFLGQGR